MAKMTKTQARKRLTESQIKLSNVYVGNWGGKSLLKPGDLAKLVKMIQDLETISDKLR